MTSPVDPIQNTSSRTGDREQQGQRKGEIAPLFMGSSSSLETVTDAQGVMVVDWWESWGA